MLKSINIRIDYSQWFVNVTLLLFSILALEVGHYLERGLSLGQYTVQNETIGHLVTEIGFAGLVGFILMLTFERLSAKEFRDLAKKEREDITRDVFHYVYGYGIPKQITDLIDQQILRTPFIRKNMIAQFKLDTIIAPESRVKYIRVNRKFAYEVENLTDRPQPFPFSAATDRSPIAELDNEVKFLSLSVQGCSRGPIEYDEAALREREKLKGQEKYLSLNGQEIVVLPGPEHTTKIVVRSQTVRHLEGGCLYLILFNHSCDLELSVHVPNQELDVVATAYDRENVLKEKPTHEPDSGFYHWNIIRPLLAYQGVYISWKRKDSGPKEITSNQ